MSISENASNKVLDRLFGQTTLTPPTTYYVGLSTNALTFSGSITGEPSGGAYARVAVTNNKTNWANAASGILANLTSVTFTESTASWGTITHVFLASSLAGTAASDLWFYEALTASRAVADTTTVLFDVGGIEMQMDNS